MYITQETVTYLEFQTRNGEKRQLTIGTFSDCITLPSFLSKPMPCKIFKRDLKKFLRAKYRSL